jgi:hypothetical protein
MNYQVLDIINWEIEDNIFFFSLDKQKDEPKKWLLKLVG